MYIFCWELDTKSRRTERGRRRKSLEVGGGGGRGIRVRQPLYRKRPHDLPVKKAERKRVLNPHYNSFERDSTPYGQNVGVSEVDVFD